MLNKILELFVEECEKRNVNVDENLAHRFIYLLVHDAHDGLDVRDFSNCKIQRFIDAGVKKLLDPFDPTVCNIKLTHYFKNCKELNIEYLKERHEATNKNKLENLVHQILQYSETANAEQTEQMASKILVFTIANYNIGCPINPVLLKLTRQAFNSVLGKHDLRNFTRKNKFYRWQYLERLSGTVCGIVVFNNHGPTGDKENMHNIFEDLNMATRNTKESLDDALKHVAKNKSYGTSVVEYIIKINIEQRKVVYHWPLEKVRIVNKFLILFNVYERCLKDVSQVFEKTEYLIKVSEGKFMCVVDKINDLLKCRTAIDSELIFPHFVYLSELWRELVLYLNNLAEINKIREMLNSFIPDELEAKFFEVSEQFKTESESLKFYKETSFEELIGRTYPRACKANLLNIKEPIKEYCSLTMALTNGLLLPANIQKKLCPNLELKFGFVNIEFAKYAERNFEEYLETFLNVVFTSADLILLFKLENDFLDQLCENPKGLRTNVGNQTEMVIENDTTTPNRIHATWNGWDFYRETIRLANLRKMQTTHSSQTTVTYGRRNEQNQAYNTRQF